MNNTLALPHAEHKTFSNTVQKIMLLGLGSLALAITARIQIPLQPVPVTLQDATVVLIGMLMGWRLGAMTVMVYFLEGIFGLPVFASGLVGPAAFMGPDAGYLCAFLPAVLLSGYLANTHTVKAWLTIPLSALAGLGVIFLGGTSVLAAFVGWSHAITLGVTPFLLGDALKLTFVCVVMLTLRRTSVKAPK